MGDILRLYSAFGRVANDAKNGEGQSNIAQPFVLFGPNTKGKSLKKADLLKTTSVKAKTTTHSAPLLKAEGTSHFILKAVEPLTGISCTRSYFLKGWWNGDDGERNMGAGVLAEIYTFVVKTTLKAIEIYNDVKSPAASRKFVGEQSTGYLANHASTIRCESWEFRLEGFGRDRGEVFLTEGKTQKCLKRATIVVYDVTRRNTVDTGDDQWLGSVAFAESFVDSRVTTKNYKGQAGISDAAFCLTEGAVD